LRIVELVTPSALAMTTTTTTTMTRYAVALTAFVALCCATAADEPSPTRPTEADVRGLMDMVDGLLDAADSWRLARGVRVKSSAADADNSTAVVAADRERDPEKYLLDRLARYAGTHVLDVDFAEIFRGAAGRAFFSLPQLREYRFKNNNQNNND